MFLATLEYDLLPAAAHLKLVDLLDKSTLLRPFEIDLPDLKPSSRLENCLSPLQLAELRQGPLQGLDSFAAQSCWQTG